ncbi:hypothetical protein BH11CYA1_BH11CYA1_09590 [soil metagenome]
MNQFLYRCTLVVVFVATGSLTAWLFDESHILQGVTDVSEARAILNKEHLEMAIAGLLAGGASVLLIDIIKQRIAKKSSKSQDT